MKGLLVVISASTLLASPSFARYNHIHNPPEPAFRQVNFLRIPGIPEMNLDFALAWTDSAAGFFIQPFDAVALHVIIDQEPHDVFMFSDVGMQRLCIWMCTPPDENGDRLPETITAYYGEDCGYLKAPSGITTSARNRLFDPENDLIYLADRGNDRILELAYSPDKDGGQVRLNRSLGQGYVEWPIDVALCGYGGSDPATTDIFVVDWGHAVDDGELLRFNLNGDFRGSWKEIPPPKGETPLFPYAKPMSIECFPDTLSGYEAIYISEAKESRIFFNLVSIDTEPRDEMLQDLEITSNFWESGGVTCDDYGRTYICNYSVGMIEMWEPEIGYPYPPFSKAGRNEDSLEYPSSIVLDTYYGVCEALVIERYGRQTGIKTFIIDGGSSLSKPPLGFVGGNLVRPAKTAAPQLPLVYDLYSAYPNPFNSECLIRFSLPEKARVTIDVFNVLGQEVSRLLDEERSPGHHSVAFNARGLSSGTYFYRMNAGTFSKTKMVVLVK